MVLGRGIGYCRGNAMRKKQGMSEVAKVEAVARLLRRRYADFDHFNRKNPLEELLFILCSVQTDEEKYRQTFAALRRRFPRFEDIGRARRRDIAKALKPGGLSPTKSRMIQGLCRTIGRRFGRVTLSPLKQMSDTECEALLTSLPGIGVKVARCVMLYSLGRKVFPVDTHFVSFCIPVLPRRTPVRYRHQIRVREGHSPIVPRIAPRVLKIRAKTVQNGPSRRIVWERKPLYSSYFHLSPRDS